MMTDHDWRRKRDEQRERETHPLEAKLQTLRNRVGDLVYENQTLRILKGALEKRIAELLFGGIDLGS